MTTYPNPMDRLVCRIESLLRGDNVRLRTMSDEDVTMLASWNMLGTVGFLNWGVSALPSGAEQLEFFCRWAANREPHQVGFAIDAPGDNGELVLAGAIKVSDMSPSHRMGRIGMFLSPEMTGQGHGTDALRVMVRYGFEELGLHRLHAEVLGTNERSIRMLQKVGFTLEGRQRQSRRLGGQWEDLVMLGILDSEWASAAPRDGEQNR